jgi:ribosomal-protein-alanine N-acetyltransferase
LSVGYTIRVFRSEDLERVMSINEECLPENYSAYFYTGLYQKFPFTFLVAEADGELQGYIMCRIERGFSKLGGLVPTRLCHIVSIAVREPYRRRGIAYNIITQAMKNGSEEYGAAECYLEVRFSNEPAIKLYEKLRFDKVKRNYGYYIDGEDAWTMAAPIRK